MAWDPHCVNRDPHATATLPPVGSACRLMSRAPSRLSALTAFHATLPRTAPSDAATGACSAISVESSLSGPGCTVAGQRLEKVASGYLEGDRLGPTGCPWSTPRDSECAIRRVGGARDRGSAAADGDRRMREQITTIDPSRRNDGGSHDPRRVRFPSASTRCPLPPHSLNVHT